MQPKKTSSRSLRYATVQDMPEGMRRLVQASAPAAGPAPAAPRAYRPPSAVQPSGSGNAAGKVARGRPRHVPGEMNKTEEAYSDATGSRTNALPGGRVRARSTARPPRADSPYGS